MPSSKRSPQERRDSREHQNRGHQQAAEGYHRLRQRPAGGLTPPAPWNLERKEGIDVEKRVIEMDTKKLLKAVIAFATALLEG